MIVNENSKISELIDAKAEAIDAIASVNKNFLKLKNPLLRKMLAARVSVRDASRIGNTNVCTLLDKLEEIGFTVEYPNCERKMNKNLNNNKMTNENVIELDVRPILAGGVDPFNAIMEKLNEMDDAKTLQVINTFEPVPLLNILKKKGYEYKVERPVDGEVHTFLTRNIENKEDISEVKESDIELSYEDIERKYEGKSTEIDVRDLEMPMPMVTILEALEKIEIGSALFVHHKKLPQYLIPELENRNFVFVSKEIGQDDLKLIIYKK